MWKFIKRFAVLGMPGLCLVIDYHSMTPVEQVVLCVVMGVVSGVLLSVHDFAMEK